MTNGRVQFVTPLPPLPTGIAQYSRDLLTAIDGGWPLDIVAESGSRTDCFPSGNAVGRFRRGVPSVFQIGNSGFHRIAFEQARREPGVLVLHDVVLHHGRRVEMLRTSGGATYPRLMRERYGEAGSRVVAEILAGRPVDDVNAYPLSEDYIERSRVTIVHSQYARDLALRLVPGADVRVVPMGIPLPVLVDQAEARHQLRLPEQAFIVASITHVNPHKRLPVVLRAMRRLVARVPEAMLVVAGSVAPGIDLERQVSLLNLERHVRLLGYVSDDEARLVARAADACVNLRYPSAGETSASLLRLLGAGRPVLVTDDAPMAEYPRSAVLPVPVDRFEDEMVADLLHLLATDRQLFENAGVAAREFVERHHSMRVAVDGYRDAIEAAFGVSLPRLAIMNQHEAVPQVQRVERPVAHFSVLDAAVADSLASLRLSAHDATIERVATAMTELGLDHMTLRENGREPDEPVAANPPGTP